MSPITSLEWISECGEYKVTISKACYSQMLQLARKHSPVEVGTSLVGRYSADGHEAKILDLAPLTPDSSGSRSEFRRGVQGLHTFYGRLFRRFGRQRHYVGEWHSHPGGAPSPSQKDNINQGAIAADTKTNCPEAILIILGGDVSADAQLGVYVYSRSRGRIDLATASP
jgi:integrative and conjugative element protein (TIGR02256 family)